NCLNLVALTRTTQSVSFVHSTVKKYLIETAPVHFKIDLESANAHFGQVCYTYLSFEELGTQVVPSRLLNSDIVNYPASEWIEQIPHHSGNSRTIQLGFNLINTRYWSNHERPVSDNLSNGHTTQ